MKISMMGKMSLKVLTSSVRVTFEIEKDSDIIALLLPFEGAVMYTDITGKHTEAIPAGLRRRIFSYFEEYAKQNGMERSEMDSLRDVLMGVFCKQAGVEKFSLSKGPKEYVERFNDFLVDWCVFNSCLPNYPYKLICNPNSLVYISYEHNVCGICGRPATGGKHHIDVIGMGGTKDDSEMRVIKLCQEHHIEEAHGQGTNKFKNEYGLDKITIVKGQINAFIF